ncbi:MULTISPECIES: Xaa-Pro peptidase family protein [unclassified Facklamia]|uniref:M24 family metallopeptidase n=1 Tax=Aerococcaceae TaxID=186827 RepID=UPI00196774D0|nr:MULTISPECIES: Xaa-Pro peptidase family protein [unclassified Facklamia]
MIHYTRISSLIEELNRQKLSDLIISNPTTIFYLTGYENLHPGERFYVLHVTAQGDFYLYLNRLFPEPVSLPENTKVIYHYDGEPALIPLAESIAANAHIGIDKDWPSRFLLELIALKPQATFTNGSPVSDGLRGVKSAEEIETMLEASHRNDQVMTAIIEKVPMGLSEATMVGELATLYRQHECDGFSFDPIIAYGANGADPHHITNEDTPKLGDSVIIDIGSFYGGYASDMTRTVFYGEPSDEAKKVYQTVLAANLAAIAQVKPGVTFASIDKAARDVIEAAGYGPYFTHRTGHSIGIEVHEPSDVGPFNQDTVKVGNVFSIEPGIYLPGKLGVRIEDLVVVTEDGCRVLNEAPKDLHIISPK